MEKNELIGKIEEALVGRLGEVARSGSDVSRDFSEALSAFSLYQLSEKVPMTSAGLALRGDKAEEWSESEVSILETFNNAVRNKDGEKSASNDLRIFSLYAAAMKFRRDF